MQTWLLDSDTTFHVSPNSEGFSDYSSDAGGTVRLGNEQECTIVGINEIPIQLPNDNTVTLHQVWHVPPLKRSLVSIGMLDKDGYIATLSDSSWMINRGNMKIWGGYKYTNLYPLMAINLEGFVNLAESCDSNLWHGRLSHMSQTGLDRLRPETLDEDEIL